MKVIYLITVNGHGRGGHIYSCLETARQVGLKNEVEIVSIGACKSAIFINSDVKYTHIYNESLISTRKKVFDYIKQERPDLLHSFDTRSSYFSKYAARKARIKHVLTKCGGPNPRLYYPYADSIVLFSLENKVFFDSNRKFKNSKIYLISNRVDVDAIESCTENCSSILNSLPPDIKIILRIGRINNAYERSIEQSAELVEQLNREGVDVFLIVIGVVEDKLIFERLKERFGSYTIFLTDNKYTVSASKNIEIADAVVGTGRGFMEAALLGKLMLAPTANRKYPEVIDKNNFHKILSTNFSQRYNTILSDSELLDKACKELSKDVVSSDKFLFNEYDENFSSKYLCLKYKSVYQEAKIPRLKYFEEILHLLYMFKIYLFDKFK